ncbi:MAG: hypothetical protein ABW173_04310 [Sphingomonas sp.]
MSRPFRKPFNSPRLTPEEAARQGRATNLALAAFGAADAIAFINTHDETLGGRPIDIAVASAEGMTRVEQAISAQAAASSGN